ncbi:capsular polysaccharide export protein, LipB/KpsS family [Novosphingobium huizhouense]|uniref:capsular polysaccharide export protein, LipB/KpsS family n=1 Tax=Novosphingobium huizhouense TaxID=2866625 RepID=UPI001CD8842C|nr:capsular biosynthesis protein [Novosphingobium huizhouense]
MLSAAPRFGRIVGVGMRRWKAYNLAPILAAQCRALRFCADAAAARALAPGPGDALAVWGAIAPAGVKRLAGETGATLLRIEDGFVRSVGLGSDLIAPQSLVIDEIGIYFDATRPSRLETILNGAAFDDALLARAAAARATIVEQGLTKYNIEARTAPAWRGAGRRIVLVPGQVESDASIALGGTDVRSNLALLERVRATCPDACIVYKPHPDVMSGNRRGRGAEREAMAIADVVETQCSIVSCIEACDEVHTITSLAGFDALLRNKPVTTWGMPFYAGWGATTDRAPLAAAAARRTTRLSVDQIVAGTLLQYPLYWDELHQRPTNCESVLSNIARQRNMLERDGKLDGLRTGGTARLTRKLRTLGRAWLGARSRDRWWN